MRLLPVEARENAAALNEALCHHGACCASRVAPSSSSRDEARRWSSSRGCLWRHPSAPAQRPPQRAAPDDVPPSGVRRRLLALTCLSPAALPPASLRARQTPLLLLVTQHSTVPPAAFVRPSSAAAWVLRFVARAFRWDEGMGPAPSRSAPLDSTRKCAARQPVTVAHGSNFAALQNATG